MNRRMVDDPPNALAEVLLCSAERDGPGPDDRKRVARQLGLAPPLPASPDPSAETLDGGATGAEATAGAGAEAAAEASAAKASFTATVVKYWLVGLGTFTLVAGVWWAGSQEQTPRQHRFAQDGGPSPSSWPAPPAVPSPVVDRSADMVPSPSASSPQGNPPRRSTATSVVSSPSLPARLPPATASTGVAAPAASSSSAAPAGAEAVPTRAAQPKVLQLSDELAALEMVRRAVEAGEVARARAALNDYKRRFGQGRLAPEAALLSIEVAARRGDHVRARDLARAFLSQYSSSPHRGRVRTLLGTAEEALR